MAKFLFAGFSPETAVTCVSGLELRGHGGRSVADAAGLREALKKEKWDLLLLSFSPEDDWVGLFLAELRSHANTAALPVLAVIPPTSLSEIEKIFHLGVNECLTRPFRVGDLLDKAEGVAAGGGKKLPHREALPDLLEKVMLSICENGRRLGDVSEIASGVSAHDPKARRLLCPSADWTPAVVEDAVRPFHLGEEREFYLMRKDLMSRLPRPEEYDCPEKVLLKKTFTPVTAAMDTGRHIYNSGLYGIQTVKGLSCAYLCAVLNSRFSQFYFSRYRPPSDGLKGVYLSRVDLDAFPLLIPSPKEQKSVEELVRKLNVLTPNSDNPAKVIERGKLMGELNRRIFALQGFSEEAVRILSDLHY